MNISINIISPINKSFFSKFQLHISKMYFIFFNLNKITHKNIKIRFDKLSSMMRYSPNGIYTTQLNIFKYYIDLYTI